MSFRRLKRLAAVLPATLGLGALAAAPSQAAEQAVGLTTANPSTLVSFGVDNPAGASAPVAITFPGGAPTDLVGIDYRPRSGQLFGMASDSTLYTLAPPAGSVTTWTATRVSTPAASAFTAATAFGFDFNPTVDRIRVVNNDSAANDNNFRFNPDNGAKIDDPLVTGTNDGDLSYDTVPAEDPLDPNAGDTPNVVAAAYTNNFDGASTTTLFDIDASNDVLTTQAPPNTGTLNTVGSLGADVTNNVGFDIAQGSTTPYAAVELTAATGSTSLHTIDLSSGDASDSLGTVAGGAVLEGLSVTPASVIQFAAAATSVVEGDNTTITVTRQGALNRQVTVNYSLANGSAEAADYTPVSGTLTFAPNDSSETFSVPTLQDSDGSEGDETVNLTLATPSANAIIGAQGTSTLTIVDEDQAVDQPGAPQGLISVKGAPTLKKLGRSGTLKVAFSCNEACAVEARLRGLGRTLGSGDGTLATAGTGTLTIDLTAKGQRAARKAAKRDKSKTLKVSATFSDNDTPSNSADQLVTFKAAAR